MATLAYYYLIADPNTTFLDYNGGYDTTGPWSQHWFPAMGANIGQPTGQLVAIRHRCRSGQRRR